MRISTQLLILALFIGLASCFVCPEGYCNSVDCSGEPTKETCDGAIRPHSSQCGCCSICVKRLKIGSECSIMDVPSKPPFTMEVCPVLSTCFNQHCVALPH